MIKPRGLGARIRRNGFAERRISVSWRVLLLLCCVLATSAHAEAAATALPAGRSWIPILSQTAVASGTLPAATVLSGRAPFKPYRAGALSGWPIDVWMRVYIGPVSDGSRWFLRFSAVDRADAYVPLSSGAYVRQSSGVDIPFAVHTVPYTLPTFVITPADSSRLPIYVHLRFYPEQRLSLTLQDAPHFYRVSLRRRFMQGVFLGVLLAVLLFNLYVFVTLRAAAALWYSSFTLALALYEIVTSGVGSEYLWPDRGGNARLAVLLAGTLAFATYLLFARSFLLLRRNLPWMDRLIVGLFIVQTLIASAQYALAVGRALVAPLLIVEAALMLSVAAVGIVRWRQGFEGARFFSIAFAPMFIGVLVNLYYNAYIPLGGLWSWAAYGIETGAMLQCVIMTFSVLDRIQTIDRQRHAVELALSNQAQRNKELREIALTDPLSGIPNRLAFYDGISEALERARGTGEMVGVLFIDVDGFKHVNDAYGHSTGDELLRIVARRLTTVIRESDMAARVGGDEFAVLVRSVTDVNELEHARERVFAAFLEPIVIDTRSLRVSLSVGTGVYPMDGASVDEVVDAADRSMYEQKQRNATMTERAGGVNEQRVLMHSDALMEGDRSEPIL